MQGGIHSMESKLMQELKDQKQEVVLRRLALKTEDKNLSEKEKSLDKSIVKEWARQGTPLEEIVFGE